MRGCIFAMIWFAGAALADAPPRLVVAPAGDCAGLERDLAPPVFSERGAEDETAPVLGVTHLTPANVAGGPPLASLAVPALPAFSGPDPCDNPGSGCVLDHLIEDPDPGTGCGFPGSPCP